MYREYLARNMRLAVIVNPDAGLVYIPVNEIPFFYDKTRNIEESKSHWNIGYDAAAGWPVE